MFEYEFDGNRFTQKDVDDKATELGLTTEEYLKEYPKIQKISTQQPTPVIDTSQDSAGWITPSFFDDTEEQAKEELEQRLPDSFEIIESGFFLGDDQKRYGLTNALEIKHKDSGESIKLEFNVAGAARPDDEETMTAYYNKQVEELKQFISANLKPEEKVEQQTEREKRRVVTEAYLKEVTATEEEVQSIFEDFSDVSVFDVKEEVFRTGEAGIDLKFKTARPEIIKKTQPYKELLQQTRTKLESEQEGVVTEDQVKQAALKELRLQEVQKLEKKKTEDFLNTLDDGEMPKLTKEYWEDVETLPVPEKLKNYFTVGAKEYAEDLASTYEFQLKNKQQLNQIEQQLADFENIEEVTEQDVLDYLDVYDTYLKKVDEFNSTVEILNTYSRETVEKVEDQLSLLKKNYSLLDKTAVGLALSFRDYGAKALYGLGTQIDPASELEQTFKISKVLEKSNRIRARYADDVQFEDAFSSVKNFGKYALQLSVDQAPILASLAIPGGWSALLANSFGENYKNMTLEDFEAAVAAEAFGEEFEARSKSNKALTSLFYAAPEVVLDRMTTGLRIRGIKEMFENSATRPLMEVTTKEAFGKLAFGTPIDAAIGGVTEGSTQIWQNWITGKENLLEGVAEATFAGVIMDGGLSSIPNVKALVMSKFSDFNTYKPVREMHEQINSLKTTVQAVDPNTDYAKYLNKQIKDLEAEQSEKIREIESNIIGTNGKLGLRASDVDAYVKFTAEQENLRLQAESIINNKGLTNSKKKQLLAPLKVQFDIYSDAINKVKTGGQSNWSTYSSDFKNTKDVDTRKEEAKEKLIADGITNPTDIQIDDAARVQFNLEAIEKDIANAKEGELDKTLLVIRSKQDIEKIEDETVRQAALEAYDNGDFGFNLPQDIDGKSSLVFTENMAKGDRTQVRTHELFHEFGKQAFDNNNSIFNGMAQTIVNWAKINDKALYETLQRRVERKNGKLVNDEVIAVFMEEVADNRVKLKSERNRSLLAILGFGVNKAMKDGYDLNVDLAGVDDTFNLIYGIAKKISKGALTKAEIDALAETKAIKQLKKEGQRIAEQYLFETQGEAAKYAKNTQQKIDDLGNKYTREEWVEYGADETLTEIYSDLEKLIGSKAFMLDRLPNFSKEDFISETIAELFSHIRNFNIDRKKTDKGFGLSGWINSQLMNKIGNVLKKKTATTETYTIDEEAETFQEIPEDTDPMELFEEEDLSLQAQLKKKQQAQLLAEKGIVEGASYSTFRQELVFNGVEGINETMKDIIEQTVLDILTSPEYSSLDIDAIQNKLQRTFEVKLKKAIQDAMGVEADYIEFLSKNKDILLKNLDIASLVAIERKIDAKDKILTEFVRRLTTQQDVQDAIDNGWLSHIDNPAQGPNLYKILKPNTEQFIKFYTPPLKVESPKKVDRWNAMAPAAQQAIAENTGKTLEQARRDFVLVRSGLKGTRKDTLAERIAGQLAFDATMQVLQSPSFELRRQQLGLTPLPLVKIKEIARVIDRGIDVRFATKDGDYVQVTADIARAATVILKDAYANKETNKGLKITDDISELLSKENLEFLGEFGSVAAEIADSFISYYYITRSQISEDDYLLEDVLKLTINYNAENFEEGKKVNAGTAMEQVIINMFSGAVKSVGLEMPNTPIEKGEAADVTFQLVKDDIEYGLENKMTRSQGPQTTIRPIKDETGQYQLYVMGEGKKSKPLFSENEFSLLPDQDVAAWSLVQQIVNQQINTLNSIFKKENAGEFKGWETKLTKEQLEVFSRLLYRGAFSTVIEAENGFSSSEVARKYDQKLKKQGSIHIGMAGLSLMPSTDPATVQDNELIQNRFQEETDIKIPYLNENFPISVQFMLKNGRIAFKVNAIIDGRNITDSQVDLRNKDHIKAYAVAVKEALTARKAKKIGADLTTAVRNARKVNQNTESVGMSTFDFDETLIIKGENFVTATKGEQTKTISSEQWPIQGPQLAAEGWKFDFSDFVNVRGGVDGPLMKEFKKKLAKFGPKNMYVLTARPQESAKAIHGWLKSKGINIPLANITGLGNSTGDAKAQWMLEKFAEGYNDMYFVDDALPNVEAVKHVLNQLDIKSDVQQAKIRFASNMSDYVNDMLERSRGIKADEKISRAISRKLGKNKNRFQVFIPPSAEDFLGLLYYITDKGAKGEKDLEFFREALLDPFSRAYTELDSARMTILNDYDKLTKNYKDVYKKLGKTMPNSKYTFDNAIRVYLFNKHGHEIPGITQEEVANLVQRVNADMELLVFAETLDMLTKAEEYVSPTETWTVESIPSDLQKVVEGIHRKTFLEEWTQNKNEIFSEDNLNKMEATLGTYWREAMEDILYRMETGINRPRGRNRIDNIFSNWINNSIGAIMFFNTKSSLLQTISTANYINFEDNNIFAAGRAFANQKQYWADFTFLFNSDYLKSRRAGLKTDVSQSEIASAVATASNKALAALRFLLKIGFTPTQAADSFAISAGGATFYRNRVNKYLKEGRTQKEAQDQAFVDFREVTEESQQSARPDKISMQQTTNAGKLILAFMNAPMQYTRIQKKAALDLIKRRGNDKANISRIIYYGAIQNFIFTAMQNAIFALFADEEEEEAAPTTPMTRKAYNKMKADRERADKKKAKFEQQKYDRIINGMIDTIVRGTGITGAALTTLKNVYLKFESEWAELKGEKPGQFDIDAVLVEAAQISPAVGSKLRKGQRGLRTLKFDHLAIDEMSKLNTENPLWLATAPVVEGLTNIPVDRILNKINNLKAATDTQNEPWQRAAVVLGWSRWDVGIETGVEAKQAKKEAIKKRQEKKKQCIKIKADGTRCKNTVTGTGSLCYAHK